MTPSYTADIRPLFTDEDVSHMSGFFDLSAYQDVKDNSAAILDRVSRPGNAAGRMPPPPRAHWTPEQVQLLQDWIDGGFQP